MHGPGYASEVRAAGVGRCPAALSLIDQSSSLAAEVLELLATAVYLLGYMGCRVNPCWRGPTR
jgi:hypothetical protein